MPFMIAIFIFRCITSAISGLVNFLYLIIKNRKIITIISVIIILIPFLIVLSFIMSFLWRKEYTYWFICAVIAVILNFLIIPLEIIKIGQDDKQEGTEHNESLRDEE
jgi:hypothetical protein